MQALYALSRGRSPKAQVGDVILQSGDGEPFHARGLFALGDGFNSGDFIGFYTGTWTDSRCPTLQTRPPAPLMNERDDRYHP